MNIQDIVLFIAKYIPFWAVPIGLMSVHFCYLYWLKGYREMAYIWGTIVLFCLTFVVIYLLMGGPDQITSTLAQIFN
jgi:membrane-anchored protein YejM (alkaline phosphatase superfamily)